MTQEQKDLLLKDLCARLPYGVICKDTNINFTGTLSQIGLHYDMCTLDKDNGDSESCYILNCKPYLFPLSSITEEQREEFLNIQTEERKILFDALIEYKYGKYDKIPVIASYKQIEWLNRNHFDYRGLIDKGLAIDATGKNIY